MLPRVCRQRCKKLVANGGTTAGMRFRVVVDVFVVGRWRGGCSGIFRAVEERRNPAKHA